MNPKPLLAEFIGTFALCFVGVCAITMDGITGGKLGLVGIALAHGLTIAVMVSATGAVSGGHLNPAVSVAALLTGKLPLASTIGYIIAQCLAGVAAMAVVKGILPADALQKAGFGVPAPGEGFGTGAVLVMEVVLTFFLVFVVFGTAVDSRAAKMGGLFIGLTVALDILAGGPVSGGAMNPARHLGPALLSGDGKHIANIWIYWVGPVIGGVLGALAYQFGLADRGASTAK